MSIDNDVQIVYMKLCKIAEWATVGVRVGETNLTAGRGGNRNCTDQWGYRADLCEKRKKHREKQKKQSTHRQGVSTIKKL